MKAILISIAKKLGYLLAGLIILAAVLVSLSRLLTPVLDGYLPEIEKRASSLLGAPVKVGSAEIAWYQYQPGINLKNVKFLDKKTQVPVIEINKIGVFFSIPQSIWQHQWIPSGLVLSGSDVNVNQTATGDIVVQGLPSIGEQPLQGETKFTDVVNFLSAQPRLILRDIDVHYINNVGQKRYITLYNLSFKNSDNTHVILGKAILHQNLSTDATVAVEWDGKTFDLAKIQAKVYIYVSGFSFSQWLTKYSLGGWSINNGIGSAKTWATWENGTFTRLQTTFQIFDIELYSATNKSIHKINRLSGDVAWKRVGADQVIAGDDILIDLSSHLLPVTSFYLSYTQDAQGKFIPKTANLGYVNLKDLQEYLFAMPSVLSVGNQKIVSDLNITGALQNAAVVFGDDWTDINKTSVTANVSELSFSPWKNVPGIKNLTGKIKWNGNEGNLALQSNQVRFQYDSVFMNPLDVDQLTGSIKWQRDQNKSWIFTIPNLQALNADLVANIKGTLTIQPDGAAISDLAGNFALQKAIHVARYLPLKIFDAGLVKWLREAFLAGSVKSGDLILKGKLSDFPFDKNDGTFFISGLANNINLKFAPDWPAINRINAKLVFSGRQMAIDVMQAETLGIPIGEVHATIPYFGEDKPAILSVVSKEIETQFSSGLNYVHSSPLEDTIGKMFTDTEATGAVSLLLDLTVPLNDPDKIQVKGDLTLKNNDVKLVPWNLQLNKVNGSVQFTENTTHSDKIDGLLFNKPISISLSTVQKSNNIAVARASFTNNLSIADLENWLKMPFSKVVQGETKVDGYIDFSPKTPIEIHLQSVLAGLTVDLPDGYAKKVDETRDFTADLTVQANQPLRIKTSYGKMVSAALILKRTHDTFKLTSINLRIGGGDPAWPASEGLYISGNIPQLDWEKIKQYASQSTNAKKQSFSGYTLRGIDVQIGKLNLPGLALSQTRLELAPNKNYWDVVITNADIDGEMRVPVNFSAANTLTAQFNKLYLSSSKSDASTKLKLDVKSLPGISLVANDVRYNDIALGKIMLRTVPNGSGASIQTLRFDAPHMELQSSGSWTQSGTRLQGKLTSPNVGEFLNSAGMNAHNLIAGKGNIDFDLNWSGAFFAPALSSMNGTLALKIGAGRIVDVGESSDAKLGLGRLLSIFSLQTIPKRLTLDFSDLFQKGYSFDSLTGDFNLKNGNAYTSNMSFKGTVARVDINGRIGLSNQDLDFTLSVTPGDVTSGLPVAATLLGGPVGGIAALAVNTVIGSQISKAATHYYLVRGSWSNPSWDSVNTSPRTPRTR